MTNKHLEASRSYYHDALTWCVQKSQPIPLWRYVFYLCNDPLVYIIFTITGLVVLSLGYYLQQFERHPKWDWNKFIFNGYSSFLGFPCCYNPRITANRIGFMFCLLGGIIFVCTLTTVLFDLALTPILKPQVQSIQGIIDGNFKLVGDRFAFQKISQQTKVKYCEWLEK